MCHVYRVQGWPCLIIDSLHCRPWWPLDANIGQRYPFCQLPTSPTTVCLLLSWWPHANPALPHPSYRRYRLPWDRIGKATHPYWRFIFPQSHGSWLKIRVGSFILLPFLPDQLAFPPPPLLPVTIRRPPSQLLPILGVAPTSTCRVLARLHLKVPS